jgi:hypothetical protein
MRSKAAECAADQVLLPAAYTFTAADAGMHTFAVALRTAGTQSSQARTRRARCWVTGLSGIDEVEINAGGGGNIFTVDDVPGLNDLHPTAMTVVLDTGSGGERIGEIAGKEAQQVHPISPTG